MMSDARRPLYYTFGNHMHWVDMEWLWGYQVLPDSVRDMLHFCAETGARGNLNFDAIGYERLAVEAPEALQALREALARGQIEVVGASYGQPYGLFHGGESNVRQRTYGVRTVLRLLGVRPRTFWEEEFDFFPQLPQILRGVGYEYASLFFQWTWHTPSVPQEEVPAVWWEGLDGSRILAASRNALNLHQWPEDFAGLLDGPAPREMPAAGIVQWLELMPSPDWMCRSELLLPKLRELMAHPDFEIRPVTLSEYLDVAREHAPVRNYTLGDVFHGMSLGKNGDTFRRLSRRCEQAALTAEALSALAGLLGRPYPSWNVYPVWELEEAWRELLAAQHHDNDECEGLCGFVGRRSYERSLGLTGHIVDRTLRLLAERTAGDAGRTLVYNPLGWSRDAVVDDPDSGRPVVMRAIPPFGYRVLGHEERGHPAPAVMGHTASTSAIRLLQPDFTYLVVDGRRYRPAGGLRGFGDARTVSLRRGALEVTVDRRHGVISQIRSETFPKGALLPDAPLADLQMTRGGAVERFDKVALDLVGTLQAPQIQVRRSTNDGATVRVTISLAPELDAVDIHYQAEDLPRPDGRMHAALRTTFASAMAGPRIVHDHPYGVSEIDPAGTYLRKYPTGDWMTSPQVFEEVHNPFTALQFVDLDAREHGLLYLHDGSQAFFREGHLLRNILSMYDPWDEEYFDATLDARVRVVPHGPLAHAERWRLAQEFVRPVLVVRGAGPGGDLPSSLGPVVCDAPGVAITAFFRESEESGARLEEYAGTGMSFPYVLRLVELNGAATTARLTLRGPVAAAFRANLLGERQETLQVTAAGPPGAAPESRCAIELTIRPHEIATVYLDLVQGRKVARNLDDYRSVWATVHRVGEE